MDIANGEKVAFDGLGPPTKILNLLSSFPSMYARIASQTANIALKQPYDVCQTNIELPEVFKTILKKKQLNYSWHLSY